MKKKENVYLVVNWSKQALEQLDKALDYLIENGFATYAFEVNARIILKTDNLIENYNIILLTNTEKSIARSITPLKLTIIEFHIRLLKRLLQ